MSNLAERFKNKFDGQSNFSRFIFFFNFLKFNVCPNGNTFMQYMYINNSF